MDVTNLVSTLGFPIICAICCGKFIYKIWDDTQAQNKEREDNFNAHIDKFSEILQKHNDVLTGIISALDRIDDRLNDIEDKIK